MELEPAPPGILSSKCLMILKTRYPSTRPSPVCWLFLRLWLIDKMAASHPPPSFDPSCKKKGAPLSRILSPDLSQRDSRSMTLRLARESGRSTNGLEVEEIGAW